MAQHDYVIDNSTGANVRSDINSVLQAISSNNSGSSAPSTTYALQFFANTTDSMLQLRNAANNAFVNLRKFDGTLPLPDGSASSPSLFFDDDTNTGIFSSAADTFNVATGGVERMELGATTVFNEDGADVDFRIEGDTAANLFYVDAGNDRIGIGTSTPTSLFTVQGGEIHFGDSNSSSNSIAKLAYGGNSGELDIKGHSSSGNTIIKFFTAASGSVAEKCRIDSSGNVGIGTSSPSTNLHVKGPDGSAPKITLSEGTPESAIRSTASGTSSDLRLMTSVSGSQTTKLIVDYAGNVGIGTSSPTNALDVQGGASNTAIVARSTDSKAQISLVDNSTTGVGSVAVGAEGNALFLTSGSGGSERMRIDSSGKVQLNTTTVDAMLTIKNTNLTTTTLLSLFDVGGTGTHTQIAFSNTNGGVGTINTSGSSTSYNTSSDYRLKENIVGISDGITRLKTLKPYRFNFKVDPDKTVDGFFAHEVTPVVPEAITGTKDEVDSDNNPVYQGIDQSKLVPLLTAALQEAISKIEVLETKVAALEAA